MAQALFHDQRMEKQEPSLLSLLLKYAKHTVLASGKDKETDDLLKT